MSAAVETMMYAKEGGVPWHGLGTQVEGYQTSAEAIAAAGLDWTVAFGPLYGGPNKRDAVQLDRLVSIYRESDGKVLGVSSERYQIYQNVEGFEFLDSLLKDGLMVYDTAGSLRGGRTVFMLARLTEGMRVGDDDFLRYLLFTMNHDAGGPIRIKHTDMRVVCANTLNAALHTGEQDYFRITHQPGMRSKLAVAQKALEISTRQSQRMAEWLEKTLTVKVSAEKERQVIEGIFGVLDDETPTATKHRVESFVDVLSEEQQTYGKTAYSVVNAITGFAAHKLRYNGTEEMRAERRMLSDLTGRASKFKQDGIEVLISIVEGVPALG